MLLCAKKFLNVVKIIKMKSLMPFFFCIFLLLISYTCSGKDTQWDKLIDDYNTHLSYKLKSKGIPGAALSIVYGQENEFVKGYGVTKLHKGQRVDENTRFRLASVSKTFAGSLTAKLANEKRFSLEDPVSKYIPEFSNTSYKNNLKCIKMLV